MARGPAERRRSLDEPGRRGEGSEGFAPGLVWEFDGGLAGSGVGVDDDEVDAAGVAVKKNGKEQNVFAPYSHDADAPIPEPSTLILIGISLTGMAGVVKLKKRRSRRNIV